MTPARFLFGNPASPLTFERAVDSIQSDINRGPTMGRHASERNAAATIRKRNMSVDQVERAMEVVGTAELGYSPSDRDRAIYEAICVRNRPAVEVAREFDLATATVRNVAHHTQRKLARRQHELDQRS